MKRKMTTQQFSKICSRDGITVKVVPYPIENPTVYELELSNPDWPDEVVFSEGWESEEELMEDFPPNEVSKEIDYILSVGHEAYIQMMYTEIYGHA